MINIRILLTLSRLDRQLGEIYFLKVLRNKKAQLWAIMASSIPGLAPPPPPPPPQLPLAKAFVGHLNFVYKKVQNKCHMVQSAHAMVYKIPKVGLKKRVQKILPHPRDYKMLSFPWKSSNSTLTVACQHIHHSLSLTFACRGVESICFVLFLVFRGARRVGDMTLTLVQISEN